MRAATLLLLAVIGLALPAGPSSAAPQNRPSAAAPPAQPRPQAPPAGDDDDDVQAAVGRTTAPRMMRAGERRRRTYASCNRDSHKRNLRGGVRRRFLIRCRLGYEPKPPRNTAPSPAAPPQQPGKRP